LVDAFIGYGIYTGMVQECTFYLMKEHGMVAKVQKHMTKQDRIAAVLCIISLHGHSKNRKFSDKIPQYEKQV
jgi:hypothetical protein